MKIPAFVVAAVAALMAGPVTAQECGEGERLFQHEALIGEPTCIPEMPERIQSTHDLSTTLPLIELGAPVIGSMGRVDANNTPYLRGVNTILGVDFSNSDIAFTGVGSAPDFEAIAALEPDLIIGTTFDEAIVEQLKLIAPTIVIDNNAEPLVYYNAVADASGRLEAFEAHLERYTKLLEDARAWLGQHDYTYSLIQANEGQFSVVAHYRSLGPVLQDLGFTQVGLGVQLRAAGEASAELSAELLPEENADFIFDTYRIDLGAQDSPTITLARMETALSNWCSVLPACEQGRYIVLPREHAGSLSFRTLEMNVHYVVSHVHGRAGLVPSR